MILIRYHSISFFFVDSSPFAEGVVLEEISPRVGLFALVEVMVFMVP